jgi:outer membrane protein TolC
MQLIRFSFLVFLLNYLLFSDNLDINLLSNTKQTILKNDFKQSDTKSDLLHDSWINPIMIKGLRSYNNQYSKTESSSLSISIDQPIFKSGGIFYALKYANANRKYTHLNIEEKQRALIKQAVEILIKIKQIELNINKQKLILSNATIDVEIKKEQYLSGTLNSSFLDNALIAKNAQAIILLGLEDKYNILIDNFELISDLDFKKAIIPHFTLIEKDKFIQNSLSIKKEIALIKQNEYQLKMEKTRYLLSLSLNGSYNYSASKNVSFGAGNAFTPDSKTYYRYGISLSIPLYNINANKNIQSKKIELSLAKLNLQDTQKESNLFYISSKRKLKFLNNKKQLIDDDYILYKKLLANTKELYTVGEKTIYDVQTLSNSLKIKELELKILTLDKQLELLNLYERVSL